MPTLPSEIDDSNNSSKSFIRRFINWFIDKFINCCIHPFQDFFASVQRVSKRDNNNRTPGEGTCFEMGIHQRLDSMNMEINTEFAFNFDFL